MVAFDEQEQATEICCTPGPTVSPPIGDVITCFPLEAGCYQVGDDPLIPPYDFGWLYLNLNTTVAGAPFVRRSAGWVETLMRAAGASASAMTPSLSTTPTSPPAGQPGRESSPGQPRQYAESRVGSVGPGPPVCVSAAFRHHPSAV